MSTLLIVFGGLIFDYCTNNRTVNVKLYEVHTKDIQESFSIKGEAVRLGNINYVFGNVKEPLEIKEGAQASVYVDGVYYDGYLQSLNPLNGSLCKATVSIVSDDEIKGTAEAKVYGDIDKNVIIVPYSCIFTDENGNDSVMVATKSYCVKRNVELGKINNSSGTQIKKGLFAEEKIILNPKGIETGDKISNDY